MSSPTSGSQAAAGARQPPPARRGRTGSRWANTRLFVTPGAAAALLLGISVLRFAYPDQAGIMLFACVPIAAFGMMYGVRGGLAAGGFAFATYLAWAALDGDGSWIEFAERPLLFFGIGGLSGYYAHGALGDHDLRRARANARLRRAVSRGELELYYQPIVAASGQTLLALEGLVRWPRDGRVVPPVDFVPDAEHDEPTIWMLTVHTLELAADDAARWADHGARVAVNLAPAIIDRPELTDVIADVISRTGLPAERLALEVTESGVAAEDSSGTSEAGGLARLRRLGLGDVAIDDFGTGRSSLSRLDRLPVDTLKIDRSLVAGAHREETAALIRGVVELAHSLGLVVVAEGVEDEPTSELLEQLGCDAIQGFHVSEPLPAAALSDRLEARRA